MKKLLCVAIFLNIATHLKGEAEIFDSQDNPLNYADHEGDLSAWYNLGRLQLSHDFILPIRCNFHSSQKKVAQSILGYNWWMPVVESSVTKLSENVVEARMIGGKSFSLFKVSSDPDEFISIDGNWTGVNNGNGDFDLKSKISKWELAFDKGKLKKMKTPSGRFLRWVYDSEGKVNSIVNDERTKILEIIYNHENSPIECLFLDEKLQKRSIELSVDKVINSGFTYSILALKKLVSPYEKIDKFNYTLNSMEMNMSATHLPESTSTTHNELFKWTPNSGLTYANGDHYKVDKDKRGGMPLITKTNIESGEEKYFYDVSRGCSILWKNNIKFENHYHLGKGDTFGKVKKNLTYDDKGNLINSIKYFYDDNGRLMRSVHNDIDFLYGYSLEGVRFVKSKSKNGELKFSVVNSDKGFTEALWSGVPRVNWDVNGNAIINFLEN